MVDFDNLDRPYFIGEIGINHNGDLNLAKKLMDAVSACNWDCAKFQKRNPEICVPEHQKSMPKETPWGSMSYLEYKEKIEFGKGEYNALSYYANQKPIDWTASVWDIDSLEFIMQYDVPFIKIPSALITNIDLLAEAGKTNKPIIISTGMSTLQEVDVAVNTLIKSGTKPIIMHTNSSYPAPKEELNLAIIPMFKKRYDCVIGYSGHEEDLEPTVIAAVLGAKVIERHITLSHDMWGTDQKASLEVVAMDMLYKRIKDIDLIIGSNKKIVTEREMKVRRKLRGE